MQCISCQAEHESKYCPNCGQKADIKPISLASIVEEGMSSVANMDRGFLYNFKSLFFQPRQLVEEYVKGRRRGVLNPLAYLLLCITAYILLVEYLKVPRVSGEFNLPETDNEKIGYAIGQFIRSNLKYFWIFTVLPLGLSIQIAYRKYNLGENLVISSFILAQSTVIAILSYAIFKFPIIFDPFVFLSIFILSYFIFKEKGKGSEAFGLTLLAFFLFVIQLIIMMIAIAYLTSQ